MKKTTFIYAGVLAGIAILLQWMEYMYVVRAFSVEIYIVLIAAFFTALGVWAGYRLTDRTHAVGFRINSAAREYLGITDREYDVLELLARGHSNQEIADRLFVSVNTVKSHIAGLYSKLDVGRRMQAVQKARELRLIP